MIDRLMTRRAGKLGNTTVRLERDGARLGVFIFGNRIARWRSPRDFDISLRGWNTVTTRKRLNALLAHTSGRIVSRRGVAYLNGVALDARAWYRIEAKGGGDD